MIFFSCKSACKYKSFQVQSAEAIVSSVPGPVMNSLVSETKVVCNDSIPNPITPVAIPVNVPLDKESKSITILNGTHIKPEKEQQNRRENSEGEQKTDSMNTDTSNDLSNESSLSPSEPMDCNSTPNISPAHAGKLSSSNEDVAMSETLVRFELNAFSLVTFYVFRLRVGACRLKRITRPQIRWSLKVARRKSESVVFSFFCNITN